MRGASWDPGPPAESMARRGRLPWARDVALGTLAALVAVLVWLAWRVSPDSPEKGTLSSQTGLPRPPAGLSTGSFVETRILRTGRLQVTQWVESRKPLGSFRLSMPAEARRQRVVARDVQVDTQAGTVYGPVTVRRSNTYDVPVPGRLLRIRYALDGVVVRSPSAPGRLLVRATFLEATYDGRSGGTRVKLVGGRVRNAACTSASVSAVPVPCGRQAGSDWVVELRGVHRNDGVIAQVDLG